MAASTCFCKMFTYTVIGLKYDFSRKCGLTQLRTPIHDVMLYFRSFHAESTMTGHHRKSTRTDTSKNMPSALFGISETGTSFCCLLSTHCILVICILQQWNYAPSYFDFLQSLFYFIQVTSIWSQEQLACVSSKRKACSCGSVTIERCLNAFRKLPTFSILGSLFKSQTVLAVALFRWWAGITKFLCAVFRVYILTVLMDWVISIQHLFVCTSDLHAKCSFSKTCHF